MVTVFINLVTIFTRPRRKLRDRPSAVSVVSTAPLSTASSWGEVAGDAVDSPTWGEVCFSPVVVESSGAVVVESSGDEDIVFH